MDNELLWRSDLEDGTYRNPILYADYSDPDVIRVGDCFYMTASSFNYTPGLPILISKDLVNWELKNYAVRNIAYDYYRNPAHAKGIWAPSIRYHDRKFWICYGMPDEGIFMTIAEDPLGVWSDPILILEGKGYIDPCPFWDEDGHAYVVHGYARSRIGFKSILGIFPLSYDGTRAIGEDKFIYDGTKTQPTIEGPKVYKRDGWYYIFAPAGGVKTGWQTVLRSRNIYGPYEEKIVLHQGSTEINGPHQGALVDTPSNEEWFIHFQDRGLYGRITHLQPVHWAEGWPVIGVNPNASGCGEPCLTYQKPGGLPAVKACYLQASDDFANKELALQWQWLGNHNRSFYSLTAKEGYLRLYCLNPSQGVPVSLWRSSNVLTQKINCPTFMAEAKLNVEGLKSGEQAGCTIMGGQYAFLAVRKQMECLSLVYIESAGSSDNREEFTVMKVDLQPDIRDITFRLALCEEDKQIVVRMSYCLEGKTFTDTGYTFTPLDHTWVGAKIGLFSVALDNLPDHGYADFEYLKVTK
jgi:beta-xylosidase